MPGTKAEKLARELKREDGWKLQIFKRRQRAFKIRGLTWIVERTFRSPDLVPIVFADQ